MDFFNFITLTLRHKLRISLFVFLVSVLTVILAFLFTPPYKAVIFTTVVPAPSSSNDFRYDGFYAVEAAEKFAETVSGWAKNPAMLDKISAATNLDVSNKITAAPQKKQNIIISARGKSSHEAGVLAEATKGAFLQELSKYNQAQERFSLLFSPTRVKFQKIVFLALIMGGVLLGIFLGISSAYFCEFFAGKISFTEEAEEITGEKVLSVIKDDDDLDIISAYLSSLKTKKEKPLLVGVDIDVSFIAKQLKADYLNFPKESKKLKSQNAIAFVSLGVTSTKSLKALKSFCGECKLVLV